MEGDAEGWNLEGIRLCKEGLYRDAIECFRQALALDPENKVYWFNKGSAYEALTWRADAVRCYGRAVTIDPQYLCAWTDKGQVHS
ncbi:MAG: tetratricopeptide repeat protein, partial [Methanomicrobiales archaeon]|nr:tetratricopeptide repeat protein [Methanomicrobiales archaeon]